MSTPITSVGTHISYISNITLSFNLHSKHYKIFQFFASRRMKKVQKVIFSICILGNQDDILHVGGVISGHTKLGIFSYTILYVYVDTELYISYLQHGVNIMLKDLIFFNVV